MEFKDVQVLVVLMVVAFLFFGTVFVAGNEPATKQAGTTKWETPTAYEFSVKAPKKSFSAVPTPEELGAK